jgi:nucleotide-binding universal stress UspA family protein
MYKKMLVPLDGSETSDLGFEEALKLAEGHDPQLLLVHVLDRSTPFAVMEATTAVTWNLILEDQRRDALDMLNRRRDQALARGIAVENRLVEFPTERVATTLCDIARTAGCDLIVMGTHGRRGFNRLSMGSEAEHVARHSPVPLLLVRLGSSKA